MSNLFLNTAGGSDSTGFGFSATGTQGGQNGDASPLASYGPLGPNIDPNSTKDGVPSDWYVEGPGRRVGYDDFSAIDWIYEYTKERQRKRLLYSSGQGILGHFRRLLDASNVWLVLVATGIAVGIIAAAIDIATDWLGDLKTGYCKSGQGGGRFYLNRSFCCWGLDGKWRLVIITASVFLKLTSSSNRLFQVSGLDAMGYCLGSVIQRGAIHRGIHILHSFLSE